MRTWTRPTVPVESGETKPYWDAARRGELLIQRCRDCQKYQYHYRAFCSHCWFGAIEDVVASGRGTVWSFTVIHRNRTPGFLEDVPYVVALVELEEGIKVLSNIVDVDPAKVAIGDPVEVTFATTEDGAWSIPLFTPQ
jgi:uncharacterized OB-fold protein